MKQALCFLRKDIHDLHYNIDEVYDGNKTKQIYNQFDLNSLKNLTPYLLDRSVCETDPNYLQVIPYISLISSLNKKIFVYSRGNSGNEGRLIGKCSVGLGGHIEEVYNHEISFESVIIDGTLRELEEEAGIELDFDEFIAFKNNFMSNSKILYSDIDEVGSVHLGLHQSLTINPSKIKRLENNVIEKGKWMTIHEIKRDLELEKWSELVINNWPSSLKK